MSKVKALVLLSGGLDSMLAAKVLMEQGIETEGISFKSCFFSTERAETVAAELGIKLKIVDFSQEHLEMVKKPKHGYGKAANPCIDCHMMMLWKASEFLGVYDFIATGEVLGQRPMSQNKRSLEIIEDQSGAKGKILRPLSAKLLLETEMEKSGLVDRDRLLGLSGRGRSEQLVLAKNFGLQSFSAPAGGCLLTEKEFGLNLKEMFAKKPACDEKDIEALRNGRNFWIQSRDGKWNLLIIGRDEKENETLLKNKKKEDIILSLKNEAGPAAILKISNCRFLMASGSIDRKVLIPEELNFENLKLDEKKSEEDIFKIAALLAGWYAKKARGREVEIEIKI